MCDTYQARCSNPRCGCRIEMHIGDWCTPRDKVHPYCTRCTRKLLRQRTDVARLKVKAVGDRAEFVHHGQKWVFDYVDRADPREGQVEGARRGEMVVIVCDDPEAHHVHLN